MIKINKKLISRIIAVGVVVLFLWYFIANIKDFSLLLTINPVFVILLMLVNVLAITANGIFMKLSISLFGKKIDFNESVRISLISSAGNFFAPAGSGLGFRAVYLKKRHGLSYSDYLSTLYCNYVMVFFVYSTLGLISILGLLGHASVSIVILAVFFTVLLTMSMAAFFIRVNVKKQHSAYNSKWARRLLEILVSVSKGWSLILADKKVSMQLLGLIVFNASIMTLGSYFIMNSIGLALSPASLLLFSMLGALSIFINITPGNLGVKEAVYIAFSSIIGLSTSQILSAAPVDRIALFFVLFLLWITYGKNLYLSMSKE